MTFVVRVDHREEFKEGKEIYLKKQEQDLDVSFKKQINIFYYHVGHTCRGRFLDVSEVW